VFRIVTIASLVLLAATQFAAAGFIAPP